MTRWEDVPYIVLDKPNKDVPVYTVKREDDVGKKRTLHRNLLLPIGHLPEQEESQITQNKVSDKVKESEANDEDDESVYIVEKPTAEDIGTESAPDTTQPAAMDSHSDGSNIESISHHSEESEQEDIETGDALENGEINETDPVKEDAETTHEKEPYVETEVNTTEPNTTTSNPERIRQEGPENIDSHDDDQESEQRERRSTRQRTKPTWMRSGEYVMLQQPEWLRKAEYLRGLASSGMFPSAEEDIGKALLKIVTDNI